MAKKKPTAQERKHMGTIASMDCACCGVPGPSIVHHLRTGQGMSQRGSHWLTVPLCESCHIDPLLGVHGEKRMLKIMDLNELDLLSKTIEKLVG